MGSVVTEIDRARAQQIHLSGNRDYDYEFPLGRAALEESIALSAQRMFKNENRRSIIYIPVDPEIPCRLLQWVDDGEEGHAASQFTTHRLDEA